MRLRAAGRASWWLLGIIALTVVVAVALSAISGIVVPLVIAVILGVLLEPIVLWIERRGLSATLATVAGLLMAAVVAVGMTMLLVFGFIEQIPEIAEQLVVGWASFLQWAQSLDIDAVMLERARQAFEDAAPSLGQGVLGLVSSTFSGAVSFAFGAFFAVFFLFFVLRDARRFPSWFAAVARLDADLVTDIDASVKQSLRGYFKGIAVTALITAPIFVLPLLLLGVPLVLPLFVLYFFLSFIPFIGAWITAAFAVLIAFGSGGPTAALIVSISLLVSNGAIQSAVSSWALGTSLRLHPVAVLLATIIGGAAAGALGMVLAAPLLAAVKHSLAAISARGASIGKAGGGEAGDAGELGQGSGGSARRP